MYYSSPEKGSFFCEVMMRNEKYGVAVHRRVPIEVASNAKDRKCLEIKTKQRNHLLKEFR